MKVVGSASWGFGQGVVVEFGIGMGGEVVSNDLGVVESGDCVEFV